MNICWMIRYINKTYDNKSRPRFTDRKVLDDDDERTKVRSTAIEFKKHKMTIFFLCFQ